MLGADLLASARIRFRGEIDIAIVADLSISRYCEVKKN